MNWTDFITAEPEVLYGKPAIRNTRIAVATILEKLATGDTTEDLLAAYPTISKEAISACLLFAADSAQHEKVLAVA